uniref:Uncharacterized protein n=1 Tax=Arundo donax TaxID=35708 RepID=A0A0A8YH41_ARUDO
MEEVVAARMVSPRAREVMPPNSRRQWSLRTILLQ